MKCNNKVWSFGNFWNGKSLSTYKNDEVTVKTCSSNSETTSDEEIDKLEKAFSKLQRITNKKTKSNNFHKKLVSQAYISEYAIWRKKLSVPILGVCW